MPKSIHFILPGGGARGSFQAGFLYKLFTEYNKLFSVYKVDGTSVGALNGIAIITEEYEVLKSTWSNINTITDLFSNWSNTPIIGSLSNIYYGFYNNGVYNNNQLHTLLHDNLEKNLKNFDESKLLGLVGLGYIDCPGWGSHYMVFDIDVNQPRSQFFSKIQQGSKKIQ
jgi:predicted patatin/cPLA2 family phospholipase